MSEEERIRQWQKPIFDDLKRYIDSRYDQMERILKPPKKRRWWRRLHGGTNAHNG